MKARFQSLALVSCLTVLAGFVVTVGCGPSAPPPAPAIEEAPTPEYEAGEAAYSKQR